MFEELRKRSIKKVIPAVVILCLAGIAILVFSAKGFFNVLGGNKAFEKLKPDEIKEGMYVEANIYGNEGIAIVEKEYPEGTSPTYGRAVASYHVIWTGEENDEDWRYMMIKLPVKYDKQMEKMLYDYLEGKETKPLTFVGKIVKAEKEEEQRFYNYLKGFGMTQKDIDEYAIPYIIEVQGAAFFKVGSTLLFLAGVALLLWGVLFMVATVKGGRLKQLRKEIAAIGYSEEQVERDYARKQELCSAPKLFAGAELLFFNEGAVSHVIKKKEVIWVYYSSTAQRVNGIKVATTYAIQIKLKNKKTYALGVSSKEKAIQAVEILSNELPWAVAGYTPELNGLFVKDFQGFLDIVYNKAITDDPYEQAAATFEDSNYEEPLR